jgi:hypothetical protein
MMMNVENSAGGGAAFVGIGDASVSTAANWKMWGGFRAFSTATKGTRAINVCNPTPTCADVNSDATTGELPATITISGTNCSGGTCTIAKIYDQTGNLQCTSGAACDWVQATTNLQPTLLFSATPNGKWCANWPGTQAGQLLLSGTMPSNPQPFVYSGIVFANTGISTAELWPDIGSGTQQRHESTANTMGVFDGSLSTFTMSDNAWHALQITWSGPTSFSAQVDNNAAQPLTNVGTGSSQNIGLAGGFSLPWSGKTCDVGLYNGSPTLINFYNNQHTWGGF